MTTYDRPHAAPPGNFAIIDDVAHLGDRPLPRAELYYSKPYYRDRAGYDPAYKYGYGFKLRTGDASFLALWNTGTYSDNYACVDEEDFVAAAATAEITVLGDEVRKAEIMKMPIPPTWHRPSGPAIWSYYSPLSIIVGSYCNTQVAQMAIAVLSEGGFEALVQWISRQEENANAL
jgi:hypothetical protein